MKKQIILSLLFILILTACSKSNTTEIRTNLIDATSEVDIWNSMQYEVTSDINLIRAIEPESSEGVILINFWIRLENRGSQPAQDFKVTLIGAKPSLHINGSMSQGVDGKELEVDTVYELMGHFTFANMEDLNQFIETSTILVEWKEQNNHKRMELKLPVKQTKGDIE
ncbi:hypothetical protein [Paenibacillus sp. FSL W7-1287]|uniref:hypothetical protein n=1 Tax=Paenibacillus sp. FSL W7-1287 TaxID=2954538 RepID=UPI0030FC2CAF